MSVTSEMPPPLSDMKCWGDYQGVHPQPISNRLVSGQLGRLQPMTFVTYRAVQKSKTDSQVATDDKENVNADKTAAKGLEAGVKQYYRDYGYCT